MKLIYIAYGNVSVFESQVVALLNHYIRSEQVNEIILILGTDYKTAINDKITKNLDNRIKVEFYKQFPQYLFIENLTVHSIFKALKEIHTINDYVIHVRNDVSAHYAFKGLKKLGIDSNKMIADVRGAGLEQLIEFSNRNKLILWLKKIQRNSVNKSLGKINHLSVVSESLKRYVYEKVGSNVDVRVNSCLANQSFKFDDKERKNLRRKLNIRDNESLLVMSTGGDNTWQNTRQVIEMLAGKNFKILNLSKTEFPHENVISRFVPYGEMFKYLCAADAAIIFRKKGITNKVASPVKFSEYVACGLPILTNDSIDLITDYIRLNDCGKILNSLDSIDENILNEMKKLNRNMISKKGQKDFGIENISNQYLNFYKTI